MKIDYVKYMNECAETLYLAVEAYRKSTADMESVRDSYRSRTAAQKHFSEDRQKTLVEIINDSAKTATVRRMAEEELASLKNCKYPPSESEQKMYSDALAAAWEAIAEIRKTKEDARIALNAVKKELEKDEKNIFSENANVQWLERMLQDDKGLTA